MMEMSKYAIEPKASVNSSPLRIVLSRQVIRLRWRGFIVLKLTLQSVVNMPNQEAIPPLRAS
jgi:hypothetical protein